MEFTYKELLAAQLRFGTTEEDLRKRDDFYMVLPNVVIAPWWEIEMFNNSNLEITKINDKVYNLKNNDVEFSFIQVKQIGAPAIIEEALGLGVTKCKNLIFIGSAGALSEDINIGDIVIPKLSICGDGASKYLNKDLKDDFGKCSMPNKNLMNKLLLAAQEGVTNVDIKVHNLNNFSIDTIFGQFPHIDKIISLGADIVEMETYTLFKASKIAGINTAALFCISDNTMKNKSLFSGRNEVEKKKRRMVRNEIIPKILIECFKNL